MTQMQADFSGCNAFVTGAGGGMGLQIARDLIGAGAEATLFDVKPAPDDLPAGARYVQADLRDAEAVAQAMADCYEAAGRLDYLVNAAGVLLLGRDRLARRYRPRRLGRRARDQPQGRGDLCPPRGASDEADGRRRHGAHLHHPVRARRRCTPGCLPGLQGGPDSHVEVHRDPVRGQPHPLQRHIARGPRRRRCSSAGSTTRRKGRATEAAVPLGRVGTPKDMANAVLFPAF